MRIPGVDLPPEQAASRRWQAMPWPCSAAMIAWAQARHCVDGGEEGQGVGHKAQGEAVPGGERSSAACSQAMGAPGGGCRAAVGDVSPLSSYDSQAMP